MIYILQNALRMQHLPHEDSIYRATFSIHPNSKLKHQLDFPAADDFYVMKNTIESEFNSHYHPVIKSRQNRKYYPSSIDKFPKAAGGSIICKYSCNECKVRFQSFPTMTIIPTNTNLHTSNPLNFVRTETIAHFRK